MTIAGAKSTTQKLPLIRRTGMGDAEVTSRIAIQPVFVDDGGRRRRLLIGTGYLAALACVGYMVVVGISLTAGPAAHPTDVAGPIAALAAPAETDDPDPADDEAQPSEAPEPAVAPPATPLRAAVRPAPAPVPTPAVIPPVVPVVTPTPVVQTSAPATTRQNSRTRTPRSSPPRPSDGPTQAPPSDPPADPAPRASPQ